MNVTVTIQEHITGEKRGELEAFVYNHKSKCLPANKSIRITSDKREKNFKEHTWTGTSERTIISPRDGKNWEPVADSIVTISRDKALCVAQVGQEKGVWTITSPKFAQIGDETAIVESASLITDKFFRSTNEVILADNSSPSSFHSGGDFQKSNDLFCGETVQTADYRVENPLSGAQVDEMIAIVKDKAETVNIQSFEENQIKKRNAKHNTHMQGMIDYTGEFTLIVYYENSPQAPKEIVAQFSGLSFLHPQG